MKTLFVMATMCLLATGVYAQKIVLEKGNIDFLKNEKEVTVKFTYENMKVGKMTEEAYIKKRKSDIEAKKPGEGEKWFQAWIQDRSLRYEPKFIELFNDQMSAKNGVTLDAGSGGKYLMTVNTFFFEPGFNIGIERKNAAISLRATFTDATGSVVAVIAVNNASANTGWGGGMDYDAAYRVQESYAKAGRELAKFLIKKLKL